jgi:hypothetical protein
MREDSTDLNRYKAPEKPSIKEQLQEKFPDYFSPEKKSSKLFTAFRSKKSKSPSISLKESLTVKEKALFIKTYHDLVIEKYKEIQSRKTIDDAPYDELIKEGEKKEVLFKELKELDKKVKKLLDEESKKFAEEVKKLSDEGSSESDEKVKKLLEQPKKLDEKLYDLSPDRYPQATILGINALASRKKSISIDDKPSSKVMSGEELFKFYLLSDLIEQQIKIDKLEKSKNHQEGQLAPNEKNISLKQAKEDLENARKKLKQAEEDLEKAKTDLEISI